jgi:hypothetical protein
MNRTFYAMLVILIRFFDIKYTEYIRDLDLQKILFIDVIICIIYGAEIGHSI